MKGLNFLAAAYTAVWVAFFVYLLALGRRAKRLEEEIAALQRPETRRV
jgi:CcmD family protein